MVLAKDLFSEFLEPGATGPVSPDSEPVEVSSNDAFGSAAGTALTGGIDYGAIAGAAADVLKSTQQQTPDQLTGEAGPAASSTATGNKVFNFGQVGGDLSGGTVSASTDQRADKATGIAATGKSFGLLAAIGGGIILLAVVAWKALKGGKR